MFGPFNVELCKVDCMEIWSVVEFTYSVLKFLYRLTPLPSEMVSSLPISRTKQDLASVSTGTAYEFLAKRPCYHGH